MKRRLIVSVLILSMMAITLPLAGCDKTTLETSANDVLASLRAAQPLIEQLLPSAKEEVAQGIDIATKLKDSIVSSDSAGAVGYLGDLIPTFQTIVRDDIPQIKDPNTRTTIMAALALADIGLNFLANHLQKNAPQAMAAARGRARANVVAAFAAEPVWGNSYKRK